MIHMPPVEQINSKRICRSMQAFLEGEQSLRWILGVIGDEKGLALGLLQAELRGYGDPARYQELEQELAKWPRPTGPRLGLGP